jgi:serine phosphatase RsbU (regulator of sigma subunit)
MNIIHVFRKAAPTMRLHSLKIRFVAAIALLYILIGMASFFAFRMAADKVVRRLGTRFAVKQALLEKSKLNSSIQRDLSLSLRLASSPLLRRWVVNENDGQLRKLAVEELENYRESFIGGSVFLAIHESGHYYFSDGKGESGFEKPRYTLHAKNPDDAWYFRTMGKVHDFELNVDYDNHLDTTKVWFNVVIKDPALGKIGLCGSGIDLTAFIREIIDSTEGGIETILLGGDGSITGHRDRRYVLHNSKVRGGAKKYTIYDLLPRESEREELRQALGSLAAGRGDVATTYLEVGGKRYLAAVSYLKEIAWFNLVLVDLDNVISSRTFLPLLAISVAALLALIISIGLLLNRMVLSPLSILAKSAGEIARGNFDSATGLESRDEIGALSRSFDYMAKMVKDHTENLERMVSERTEELNRSNRELAESNRKIMDSIRYARMIQLSILPDEDVVRACTKEFFVLYLPRDIVGGDFYYFRPADNGSFVLAVADCTGHGVSGAFMTMTAKAVLDRTIDALGCEDPAAVLKELDKLMREALSQDSSESQLDNGLEIGLCVCTPAQRSLVFAGAGIDLLVAVNGELRTVPGGRQSIGYRRSDRDFVYANTVLPVEDGMAFFLASDGILDQSGGPKGWGFGKQRFHGLLREISRLPAAEQRAAVGRELSAYQGELPQRDDITVIGFRL